MDDVQAEAGDPQHQPGQGRLIGQLGAQGVVPAPTVTSQSSNSARNVAPARPVKVIS